MDLYSEQGIEKIETQSAVVIETKTQIIFIKKQRAISYQAIPQEDHHHHQFEGSDKKKKTRQVKLKTF